MKDLHRNCTSPLYVKQPQLMCDDINDLSFAVNTKLMESIDFGKK